MRRDSLPHSLRVLLLSAFLLPLTSTPPAYAQAAADAALKDRVRTTNPAT